MGHEVSAFWAGASAIDDKLDLGVWGGARLARQDALLEGGGPWTLQGVPRPLEARWRTTRGYRTRGQALTLGCEDYPVKLAETDFPPAVLHVRGEIDLWRRPCVAIVGARKATRHGEATAWRLAWTFAHCGWVVVSGLALGIDAAAHRGAMSAREGATVAVLGHGLAHLAPRQHVGLADQVLAAGGALVTTLPDQEPPRPYRFPERNRWIAGLCQHVIVVEAGAKSGALGTARHAVAHGRAVHTIPWGWSNPVAEGCHALIEAGAGMISDVERFAAEMTGAPPIRHPEWLKRVFDGQGLEAVALGVGRGIPWILAELGRWVARGEVERLAGQRYAPAGPKKGRGRGDFGDSTRTGGGVR